MPRSSLLVLMSIALASPSPAQTAPVAERPLAGGERVRVRVGEYPAIDGTLVRSDPDSLVVVAKLAGRDTTYAFPQHSVALLERHAGTRTRVDRAMLYGLGGALLAGGVGLAMEAFLSSSLDGEGESKSSGLPAVIGLGFGVGFVAGLAQRHDKWVRVDTPVGRVTPIVESREGVALGVSLTW